MALSNAAIGELLFQRAAESTGHRQRAYARAARSALVWDEEAADLVAGERSLSELEGVGPRLAARIGAWIADPPPVPEPPPARRGFRTFAEARSILAGARQWRAELRGDLQTHTVYSDGKASVRTMALSAGQMGYRYLAITDHSKGLKVAGGIDEAELELQRSEIDRVNEELLEQAIELQVLRSLELNLDAFGEGDMESDALARLDLVVGSFHTGLRETQDQTERYLRALANPFVDIIGHPRTRRFDRRVGLKADWERVFAAAADHDKALEINSHPHRQDLEIELLRRARDTGMRLSIGTDAHDSSELRFVDVALAAAVTGGIECERIVNFMTVGELLQWTERDR